VQCGGRAASTMDCTFQFVLVPHFPAANIRYQCANIGLGCFLFEQIHIVCVKRMSLKPNMMLTFDLKLMSVKPNMLLTFDLKLMSVKPNMLLTFEQTCLAIFGHGDDVLFD
jgi:hypothetical protein